MSVLTVNATQMFGPGPSEVTPGALQERAVDHVLPGLVGRRRQLLGGAVRQLVQVGRMDAIGASAAEAANALRTLQQAVEALSVGSHTLVDALGISYANVTLDAGSLLLERMQIVTVAAGGYKAMCNYRCTWTMLGGDALPETPEPEPEP